MPKMIRTRKSKITESSFEEKRTVGNAAKELLRTLLESAGYWVYPFGYESYLTHIKDLMHQRKLKKIRAYRSIEPDARPCSG
jgi:hypothetical protein